MATLPVVSGGSVALDAGSSEVVLVGSELTQITNEKGREKNAE